MKNKSLTYRLFYNDKALVVLAILAATIIWLYIAVEKNVPTTKTLYGLNVVADGAQSIEEKFGLKCYGLDNIEPSVVVEGQRYVVGADNFKDSVSVSVDVKKIYDVGSYTLPIVAEITGEDTTADIISVSPDSVELYFDKESEKTFDIEVVVDDDDYTEEGYVHGEPYATQKTVTFTGPSSEIKKIDSVVAKISIDSTLTHTETYSTELVAITTDGSSLVYSKSDISSEVEVHVPVYKAKDFSVEAQFDGAPENLDQFITVTITPSVVRGGVLSSVSDDVEKFIIPVDYTKIDPGENTFTIPVSDVEAANGCVIVDKIDNDEFTVTVSTINLAQKTISVGKVEVAGGEYESYSPNVPVVTIVGPASAVSKYDIGDFTLYADISSVDVQRGSVIVPLTLENGSECWLKNSPQVTIVIQ